MIDEAVFKDTWTLLCERFGKDYSRPLAQAYYRALSEQLTTEEFRAGADRIFRSHDFFPKPDDFITEDVALAAWEAVYNVMRGFTMADDLPEYSRRVVGLLGGAEKLRRTKVDDVQFVRKDFMALYGQARAIERRESKPELTDGSGSATAITDTVTLGEMG